MEWDGKNLDGKTQKSEEELERERAERIIAQAKEAREVKKWRRLRKILWGADLVLLLLCGVILVLLTTVRDDRILEICPVVFSLMVPCVGILFVGNFIVVKMEKLETNRQIEWIKRLEEEKKGERLEEGSFNFFETSGTTPPVTAQPQAQSQQNAPTQTVENEMRAFVKEQKKEKETQKRIRDMKKCILYDIFLAVIVLLLMGSLLLPYVTILGDRVTIVHLMKDAFGNKSQPTEQEYMVSFYDMIENYFSWSKKESTIEIIVGCYTFGLIMGIFYGAVASVWDIVRLLFSYGYAEKNIRGELLTVTERNAMGHRKLVGTQIFGVCLSFLLYLPVYFYLRNFSGGENFGELYSVSPFMLIVPLLLLIGWIALFFYKKRLFAGNDRLEKDKVFITYYRVGMKKKK